MTVLTSLMQHHHKHCDDMFADAESAVSSREWEQARKLFVKFAAELETHFRGEEEILFPAFEAVTGMSGGPTHMMRIEHAQMRHLLEQMQSALEGEQPDGEMFAGAAETLLILMQQHNMKEENILYPMCDRSLASQVDGLAVTLKERLAEACPTPS